MMILHYVKRRSGRAGGGMVKGQKEKGPTTHPDLRLPHHQVFHRFARTRKGEDRRSMAEHLYHSARKDWRAAKKIRIMDKSDKCRRRTALVNEETNRTKNG